MEDWQIEWITKHQVKLHANTRCTVRLLSGLQSKGVLESNEVADLDDESKTTVKVKNFYLLLMTKDCYDILTEELGICKQTGAEKILHEGKAEYEKQSKEESKKVGEVDVGAQSEKGFTQEGPEDWTIQEILDLARSTKDLAFRSLNLLASTLKVSAVIERNSIGFHSALILPDTLLRDILQTWRNTVSPGDTLESLIEALGKAELATLASALEEKYKLGKYAK